MLFSIYYNQGLNKKLTKDNFQSIDDLPVNKTFIIPLKINLSQSSKTTNVWKKINPKVEKMIYSDNNVLKSKIEITIDNTKDNFIVLK